MEEVSARRESEKDEIGYATSCSIGRFALIAEHGRDGFYRGEVGRVDHRVRFVLGVVR